MAHDSSRLLRVGCLRLCAALADLCALSALMYNSSELQSRSRMMSNFLIKQHYFYQFKSIAVLLSVSHLPTSSLVSNVCFITLLKMKVELLSTCIGDCHALSLRLKRNLFENWLSSLQCQEPLISPV